MNIQSKESLLFQFENEAACKQQVETRCHTLRESCQVRATAIEKVAKSSVECQTKVNLACMTLLEEISKEKQLSTCCELFEKQKSSLTLPIESFFQLGEIELSDNKPATLSSNSTSTKKQPAVPSDPPQVSDVSTSAIEELFEFQTEFDSRCDFDFNPSFKSLRRDTTQQVVDQLFQLMFSFSTYNLDYPERRSIFIDDHWKMNAPNREFIADWTRETQAMMYQISSVCREMCSQREEAISTLNKDCQKIKETQSSFVSKALRCMNVKIQQNQDRRAEITHLFVELVKTAGNARLSSWEACLKIQAKIQRDNLKDVLDIVENLSLLRIFQMQVLRKKLIDFYTNKHRLRPPYDIKFRQKLEMYFGSIEAGPAERIDVHFQQTIKTLTDDIKRGLIVD